MPNLKNYISTLLLPIFLSGCVATMPLAVTSNNGPVKKVGEASCMTILIASIGDCSYDAAKRNGNITNVHHADQETTNFYIFARHKVKVYGE